MRTSYELLQTLVEKCELRLDAMGWHLSAKGALGVGTLLVVLLVLLR